MSTKQIESKIQHAIRVEKRTGRLTSTLLTFARDRGANPGHS